MIDFAAKVSGKTNFTTSDDTFTIESGESIRVYGIVLSNSASSAATIIRYTGRNGTEIIFDFYVGGGKVHPIDIKFIADQGLSIEATSNETSASVTVFHSHGGA